MRQRKGVSRRSFISLSGATIAGVALGSAIAPAAIRPARARAQMVGMAGEALETLQAGNGRFVAGSFTRPNQSAGRRAELANGQHPFATVLSCVDSRVPPELVFDRGFGDLFVVRSAGQVLDQAVVGSIEFGAEELHIPLLVVLGHEKCGAVAATINALTEHTEAPGSIGYLVQGIAPAVERAKSRSGDLLDNAVRANVELIVDQLKHSHVLEHLHETGALTIVGARYDLDTGAVELIA